MNKESTKKLRVRLYRAIEDKNSTPEQIRKLIAEGALKTLTDEEEEHFRRSPLYIAAQTGRVDLVQLLLDAGVDVVDFVDDGRSRRGPCTALSVAALWGYTDVVKLLLKTAEVSNKRPDLEGALCSAVYAGNVDIIRQLLAAGAEVDCPRMLRLSQWQRRMRLSKENSLISLIIKSKRRDKINFWRLCREKQPWEETPLSLAIKTERWDIIDMLLDAGSDINLVAHEYDTPLGLAARTGDTELMQHLIDRGADINGATDAYTPLIAAAKEGCEESVRFLLNHGTDVNAAAKGYTPLSAGARYANEHFVPIARILLDAGADVNAAAGKYTPLAAAAKAASTDGVRLLLDAGADVNRATEEYTPLIAAARTGNTGLIRQLLEAGADVNAAAGWRTPLIIVAYEGKIEMIRLLLEAGANVNAEACGKTALTVALERGDLALAHFLRAAGATEALFP